MSPLVAKGLRRGHCLAVTGAAIVEGRSSATPARLATQCQPIHARALCHQTYVVRWPVRCVNRSHCVWSGLCWVRMFVFDEPRLSSSIRQWVAVDELV